MPKNKTPDLICMSAPVTIAAAAEGESTNGPRKFEVVAYTGGAMQLNGWDRPVVVDLQGMKFGNSLVANLDHETTKRVGNVTSKVIEDGQLKLGGIASAATEARREVVESVDGGFVWQASIEANPLSIEEVDAGGKVTANGQDFEGPLYVARQSRLKGFAFVSHGADDNTTVSIAATAGNSTKGNDMDPKIKEWIEAMGFDVDTLDDDQKKGLVANYSGKPAPPPKDPGNEGFEKLKAEQERKRLIREHGMHACEGRFGSEIDAIKEMTEAAIQAETPVIEFRLQLAEIEAGEPRSPYSPPDQKLTSRVLEAAVCTAGRLHNVEKIYDDQTLQAAHDRFPHGISLNQLLLLGAQANGYRSDYASKMTVEAQRYAFGLERSSSIRASGFSTISISTILSNVANKFLRRGWDSIDMTPLRISAIRSVSDFKTITTVSLTGDLTFEKVGSTGEIKHGDLGEETYSNKADTYARMLAITRTDFINDDLGALTEVPRRLGRGAGLKLNDIFWTKFLNNSSFFTSGRNNVNTAVADMTVGGLEATETIFMNQTDPDGNPLGVMPEIILVPTAIKAAALTLMNSQFLIDGTSTDRTGSANIFHGRFRPESSPYMSNANYTGNSAEAWYLLADPEVMPVIEIAALNGRVEPVVESADAEFSVLGVQMRGYSDVGVELQEYRGGVRADGGSS